MHLKFSKDLESLLERLTSKPLTLKEILQETSERGLSLMIGLTVLPFLFPMPPGLSSILGLGCFLLSLQMACGRSQPWLPKKVADFYFPESVSRHILNNLQKVTRFLEKIARPRMKRVAQNPSMWRVNGFSIAWLSILLALPIPFTNSFPAVAILILVVAMLEVDGFLMCIGYVLTAFNTVFFGGIIYAVLFTPSWIINLAPSWSFFHQFFP
ncbi:exopolysaccharide biosynthesis protein [Capilliphycus salinus ALCB114379]|uniref:exopolysaccharide biosynthesis protein n=1 Tax=Capilliphycus salinus TaxID=2768948 RepID=UPI0039A49372